MKYLPLLLLLSNVAYAKHCHIDDNGNRICGENYNIKTSQRQATQAVGLDADDPANTYVNQARKHDEQTFVENKARADCLDRGRHWNAFFGTCR